MLPHNYFSLKRLGEEKSSGYISGFVTLAEQFKKKILVFEMADSDAHIDIPHAIIFRYSQYRYKKRDNEIITPPYPPHFRPVGLDEWRSSVWKNVSLRKKRERPVVSFCGWAGFPSFYRWLIYQAKNFFVLIQFLMGNTHAPLHGSGIYWRRRALRALAHPTAVDTRFIIRKSYSAQKGLDGANRIDPKHAEKEYVENISNSDFVLAPKGHGNASVRFFEALSLGRIPVLINTECVLPLEKFVDYSKFIVDVDYTRVDKTEQEIMNFYTPLSGEEFKERQKMARAAFELLRPGSFLKVILSELKKKETGSNYNANYAK